MIQRKSSEFNKNVSLEGQEKGCSQDMKFFKLNFLLLKNYRFTCNYKK